MRRLQFANETGIGQSLGRWWIRHWIERARCELANRFEGAQLLNRVSFLDNGPSADGVDVSL